MVEDDDRNLGEAQLPRRRQTGVAGDDDIVGANQNGICPPKFPHAGGDLRDLLVGVRPGVTNIGQKLIDWPNLHLEITNAEAHT